MEKGGIPLYGTLIDSYSRKYKDGDGKKWEKTEMWGAFERNDYRKESDSGIILKKGSSD